MVEDGTAKTKHEGRSTCTKERPPAHRSLHYTTLINSLNLNLQIRHLDSQQRTCQMKYLLDKNMRNSHGQSGSSRPPFYEVYWNKKITYEFSFNWSRPDVFSLKYSRVSSVKTQLNYCQLKWRHVSTHTVIIRTIIEPCLRNIKWKCTFLGSQNVYNMLCWCK